MLKFQSDYITSISKFEDFILILYVVIDDLYQSYAPNCVRNRKNIKYAKLSDSEIITIGICGELVGIDSEKAWFSFVNKNYRYLFPNLCSRSRFHRIRKSLLQVTELLREKLMEESAVLNDSYRIVDSFPLAVCKFGRARYCRSFRCDGANYGKCPSKKETYFGYKVHVLTTLDGFITSFEITPASTDDRAALKDFAAVHRNLIFLGDKGYTGEVLRRELEERGHRLFALKPSNYKDQLPKCFRRLIFRVRRRIETTFSQLSEWLHAENVMAKSFRGLCTRLVHKIFAHNLCMIINDLFHNSLDLAKIKQLVF